MRQSGNSSCNVSRYELSGVDMDTQPRDHARSARVTAPYGTDDGGQRLQPIDLDEVRRRLKDLREKKEPTIQDLLESLDLERTHADRLDTRVGQLERDVLAMNSHFGANVAEVVNPLIAKAIKEARQWRHLAFLAVGVLVVGTLAVAAILLASSVSDGVQGLHQQMASKADKAQLAKLADQLNSKADKVQVDKHLLAIELKADKSVVERLARELQDTDRSQSERINDVATEFFAKADKVQVNKLASRLRTTRQKLNQLERRVQDIQDANKGEAIPLASPAPVVKPHTM